MTPDEEHDDAIAELAAEAWTLIRGLYRVAADDDSPEGISGFNCGRSATIELAGRDKRLTGGADHGAGL